MRRRAPKKIHIQHKADLPVANKTVALLGKHGFGCTSFSSNGVGVYRKNELDSNGDIPVDAWLFYSRREFCVFYEVLEKLEEAEKKLWNYIQYLPKMGL